MIAFKDLMTTSSKQFMRVIPVITNTIVTTHKFLSCRKLIPLEAVSFTQHNSESTVYNPDARVQYAVTGSQRQQLMDTMSTHCLNSHKLSMTPSTHTETQHIRWHTPNMMTDGSTRSSSGEYTQHWMPQLETISTTCITVHLTYLTVHSLQHMISRLTPAAQHTHIHRHTHVSTSCSDTRAKWQSLLTLTDTEGIKHIL